MLDLVRRRLVARVVVGRRAHDLAVSPDGRRIWVTDNEAGQAVLLDGRSGRRRGRAAVG